MAVFLIEKKYTRNCHVENKHTNFTFGLKTKTKHLSRQIELSLTREYFSAGNALRNGYGKNKKNIKYCPHVDSLALNN